MPWTGCLLVRDGSRVGPEARTLSSSPPRAGVCVLTHCGTQVFFCKFVFWSALASLPETELRSLRRRMRGGSSSTAVAGLPLHGPAPSLSHIGEGQPIPPTPALQRRRAYWEAQDAADQQHPRVEHGPLPDPVVDILLTARERTKRPRTPQSRVGIDDYLSSFVTSNPEALLTSSIDELRAERTHRTASSAFIKWLDVTRTSNSKASELVDVPLALLSQWRRGLLPTAYTSAVDEKVRAFLYVTLRQEGSLLDFTDFSDITVRWLNRNEKPPTTAVAPSSGPRDAIMHSVQPKQQPAETPKAKPAQQQETARTTPQRKLSSAGTAKGTPRSIARVRTRVGDAAPRGLEAGGDLVSLAVDSKFVPATDRDEVAGLLREVDPDGPSLDSVRNAARGSKAAAMVAVVSIY